MHNYLTTLYCTVAVLTSCIGAMFLHEVWHPEEQGGCQGCVDVVHDEAEDFTSSGVRLAVVLCVGQGPVLYRGAVVSLHQREKNAAVNLLRSYLKKIVNDSIVTNNILHNTNN